MTESEYWSWWIKSVERDMAECPFSQTEGDDADRMKWLRAARACRSLDSRAHFTSFYGHEPEETLVASGKLPSDFKERVTDLSRCGEFPGA